MKGQPLSERGTHGQKTVDTDPGLPCMTPYTQLRIFDAEHTGLNGKAKLATPLWQPAVLVLCCNPPEGWSKAPTIFYHKHTRVTFAAKFANNDCICNIRFYTNSTSDSIFCAIL